MSAVDVFGVIIGGAGDCLVLDVGDTFEWRAAYQRDLGLMVSPVVGQIEGAGRAIKVNRSGAGVVSVSVADPPLLGVPVVAQINGSGLGVLVSVAFDGTVTYAIIEGGGQISAIPDFEFDFAAGTYFGSKTFDDIVTVRAAAALAQDSAGLWTSFDVDVMRRTDLGLLGEEERTNGIKNNSMVGGATGTPGTQFTNWLISGSVAGLVRTIVAKGVSDDGLTTATMTWVGADYLGTVMFIRPMATTEFDAVAGDTVTASFFIEGISGIDSANSMDFTLALDELTVAGAEITRYSNHFTISDTTVGGQRYDITRVMLAPNCEKAGMFLEFGGTGSTGGAKDFTIKVASPQLELGDCLTSVIPTTTVAVTRPADVITQDYEPGAAGTFVVTAVAPNQQVDATVLSISDGTTDNGYFLQRDVAGFMHALVVVASATTVDLIVGSVDNSEEFELYFAWENGTYYAKLNDGLLLSDSSAVPAGLDTIQYCGDADQSWNSRILDVAVYSLRVDADSGAPPTPYLNAVTNAQFPSGVIVATAGKELHQEVNFYVTGDEVLSELIWTATGWYAESDNIEHDLGNDQTVQGYWHIPALSKLVAMSFSGATIGTIASGTAEFRSDPLTPALLGLSEIPAGMVFSARTARQVATGANHPSTTVCNFTNDSAVEGAAGATLQINGTGALTATGGSTTCLNQQRAPVILGLGVGGAQIAIKSWLASGDSTSDGTEDSAGLGVSAVAAPAEINGGGWIRRALWNIDGVRMPFSVMARNGTGVSQLLTSMTYRQQYFKYFTHAEIGYGNLELAQSTPALTVVNLLKRYFLTLKANGVGYVTIQLIQPRCVPDGSHPDGSNDEFLTVAGQNIRPEYETGGDLRDPTNVALLATVGTSGLDAVSNPNTVICDAVDVDHWAVDGVTTFLMTPDGVHMGPHAQGLASLVFRTQVEAL